MKKYLIFIVFTFLVHNAGAAILERLAELTEKNSLRCYSNGAYEFSLYMNGNELTADYFDGDDYGEQVSIMAYKKTDNSIKVIVQKRTYEWIEPIRDKRFFTTIEMNKYFLVELEETDGEIDHFCNRLDEINLKGFIINEAALYEKTEARQGPSLQWNSAPLPLSKGTPITVTAIEKQGDAAYNTYDYWYKTSIENKPYWVFGFYIMFENKIKIR